MKKSLLLLTLLSLVFIFQGCKKREIADVTIKYEVTCTNPNRPVYITYLNESGDEDQAIVTSTFSKTIILPSNTAKKTYYVDFSCYEEYLNGAYEPQTIEVKLIEDDVTMKKESWSGSSSLYSDHTYSTKFVSYQLPSAIKYK